MKLIKKTDSILLVDDNFFNRDMLSRRLTRHGYQVTPVQSGEECLAVVEALAPSLILLDMVLPAMSGTDVAIRLRANPATKGIPIAAISSIAMDFDRNSALAAGCVAYVTKPIHFAALLELIQNYVSPEQVA